MPLTVAAVRVSRKALTAGFVRKEDLSGEPDASAPGLIFWDRAKRQVLIDEAAPFAF